MLLGRTGLGGALLRLRLLLLGAGQDLLEDLPENVHRCLLIVNGTGTDAATGTGGEGR
jgi:hypothetical protein